jgi:hypothetical protein
MASGSYLCRFGLLLAVLELSLSAAAARCSQAAEKPAADKSAADKSATDKPGDDAEKNKYLRVTRDSHDRAVSLDTSIVSFVPAKAGAAKVRVDLVAAVHIADLKYYQELNKRFAGYDVVLYELVAPEGTRIPKGGRKEKSGNLLTSVQLGMRDMLKLEFQLEKVDYTPKNFVHADLSPDEFSKSMKDKDESIASIFIRLMAAGLAKQAQGNDTSDMQLLFAFFDKDRSLALKRAMADQFQEMEGMMTAFEGPKGSTLIGERNKRALDVLKKQIAAGKKKIAIFYGGGHMADMEKHLKADFSLKPGKTEWLQAWDMKK